MLYEFNIYNGSLKDISPSKKLITTINAHSYNTLYRDADFKEAIKSSDILLPDGVSIVWASRVLKGEKINKIAGEDIFLHEMKRINDINGSCFFLGSTDRNLNLIKERAKHDYPNIRVHTYSPPYKSTFSNEDNEIMIDKVNDVKPDVLFIGMTAPKQEKWAFSHFNKLEAGHICCIGAVFDFYAGTITRAPKWMINIGLEWLYRLLKEPKRMWKRYIIGNFIFVIRIINRKIITPSQNIT